MRFRSSLLPALAPLVVLGSAGCNPNAPAPVPLRESALSAPPTEAKLPASLTVVHAGPREVVGLGEAPTVVFDRPMRVLGDEALESTPPLLIEPAVAGVWRWLGSQAATFEPRGEYPGSTAFTVRVAADAVAVDGARLAEPFSHRFESPRIQVQSASVADESLRVLDLSGAVRIRVSQRTTGEDFRGVTRFERDGAIIPVDVMEVLNGEDGSSLGGRVFEVRPAVPFVSGSRVALVVGEALHGSEGPLPMGKPFRAEFDVLGEPKLVDTMCATEDDGTCSAGSAVHLSFDAPVSVAALKGHLKVAPARELRWPKGAQPLARTASTHWLEGEFKPGETVTVTLTPGLVNARGRKLTKPLVSKLTFAPPRPYAAIELDGTYLDPATAPPAFVVNTQALTDVDAFAIPLTQPSSLSILASLDDSGAALDRDPWRAFMRSRKVVWAPGDTAKRGMFDLAAPTVPSVVGLRFRGHDGRPRTSSRLVVPGSRMLSAHVGFEGGVVWATDFVKGVPTANVNVAVVELATGREVFRGASGPDGRVSVPPLPRIEAGLAGYAVVALGASGAVESLTRFERGTWSYAYGVSSDTSPRRPLHAVLEADRDLYRPGDSVALSAVVREAHALGLKTPAGRRVRLVATNDRDERVVEKSATLSAFGTIHERIELPSHTPLGTLRVELFDDEADSKDELAALYVRVEHARPAEFQVELKASAERYVVGEPIALRGSGRYLYGAPMAGLPVRVVVSRERAASVLVDEGEARSWTSGNEALRGARRNGNVVDGVVLERETVSDAQGVMTLEQVLPLPQLEDDERLTFEAEYKDLTNRTGAGRGAVRVFSSTRRVFLREPRESVMRPKRPIAFGVRVVDPADADQVGASVDVRLLRFVDRTAKRTSSDGRVLHEELVRDETEVERCSLRTTADRRGCALTPKQPGQHVVEAVTKDASGRESRSSFFVWVTEPSEQAVYAEGDTRDLELVVGAPSYKPGETAKVLVKNPWPGAQALVTLEREGVRRSEVRTLGASESLELPIDATMVPEVHVGVHLLRPRSDVKGEGDGDRLARVGMTTIRVESPSRELKVSVGAAKASYDPGQEVNGSLRVVDALGQPVKAEVTVVAVDEGMIVLTGHEPPNTAQAIDPYRPIAQQIVEPRFRMARFVARGDRMSRSAAFAEKGAEGGDGAVRSDFTPLAAFVSGIVTDAEGRASFAFKLPDTLTRYRLQVLAVGEGDRYGHGRSTFEVKKALMVRPFLPRVLRVGDSAFARVALQGPGLAGEADVDVSATAGLVARLSGARELRDSRGASLLLGLGAPEAGDAMLTVRASLGAAKDAIALPLRIVDPRAVERYATFGDANGAVSEALGDWSRFDARGSSFEVYAYGSPYVGLASTLAGVEAYPYDCTEQLTSKLLARLALADLRRSLGDKLLLDVEASAALVRAIVARQDAAGLFPYWSGYDADAALTAYVLEVFGRAARAGVAVPAGPMAAMRRAVVWRLRSAVGDERAALLAALAESTPVATPNSEEAQAIASAFAAALGEKKILSAAGRAELVRTAARLGSTADLTRELAALVAEQVRVTGLEASVSAPSYRGIDRSASLSAMTLRSLALADPHHRLLSPLARGLVRATLGAKWPSPREVALALQALATTAEKSEPSAREVVVRVGELERTLALASPLASASTRFALSELPRNGGRLDLLASGGFGYRAILHAKESSLPKSGEDRGIHVERTYTFLKAAELDAYEKHDLRRASATSGVLGDLVSIERIVVNASPLDHVVLDDPLPGALEVIDRTLETEARFGTSAFADGDASVRWYDVPRHTERLPDRVRTVWEHLPAGVHRTTTLARAAFAGTFVAPPATAEAMYEPDLRGRSASSSVRIAQP